MTLAKFKKIYYRWHLDYVSLFLLIVIYYTWLQWNNYIGDPDGFYHAKIALFLRHGQLLKSLPWMQFSTLKESFTDHHLLYHILLIPFTYFKNPLIGVKIATVLFSSSMLVSLYWLLKKLRIIYPYLFALLTISFVSFNFRLNLIKANGLALLVIWLLIYALFTKHWKLTFILSWIFVWLYGGWPLAIIILFFYLLADYIYHKIKKTTHNKSYRLRLIIGMMGGLTLGLVVNPYWPHNLYFYYQQIIQIGVINLGNQFTVGAEWYGLNPMEVMSSAPHLFVLAILCMVLLIFNNQLISKKTIFSFALSFAFLLLTIKSRRYIEYLLPFTLLFMACGSTDLRSIISWKKIKIFWFSINIYLKIYLATGLLVFVVTILPPLAKKMFYLSVPKSFPIGKFQVAANWLKNNTPPKSIIMHGDWDDWPMLFYYNDQNYYIVGLDPTFMHNFDKDLHRLYLEITKGEIEDDLTQKIITKFDSKFVLIDKSANQEFIDQLKEHPDSQIVYQDEEVIIYQLNLQ